MRAVSKRLGDVLRRTPALWGVRPRPGQFWRLRSVERGVSLPRAGWHVRRRSCTIGVRWCDSLQCVAYAYDVQPTHRVGVVGLGGLGHLAIEFASKMGCEVVVFSGTEGEERRGATTRGQRILRNEGRERAPSQQED